MPELPATVRAIGEAKVTVQHGPEGYRAVAVAGQLKLVMADSGWKPGIGEALAALAAAMTPGFTRSAARAMRAPAGDEK